MKKVVSLILALLLLAAVSVAVADEGALIQIGDYNNSVIALHEKLNELGLLTLRPESPWSAVSAEAIKKLQEYIGLEATGYVQDKDEFEKIMKVEKIVGKNLAAETSSEWSEWMTPKTDKNNSTFTVTYAELGEKSVGDAYTCSLEIEFKDVKATSIDNEEQKFSFRTQGAVDKAWDLGNIWNSNIVKLTEVPKDGVYYYTATNKITEKNVGASQFNLGFRCDYWSSGSFRVRKIKVEKGTVATEWTPAE